MRAALFILVGSSLLAGCASDMSERANYPDLSDVKDRPTVILTPERTDVLTATLNVERVNAQSFAALGFREEQTLENAMRAADAAAAIPEPISATPVAPPAVPLEAVQERIAPPPVVRPAPPNAISDEAIANSDQPEEVLAKDPEFK